MPAPRQLPGTEVLLSLRKQKWTYEQIANEYGVTPGAVYLRLREAGAVKKRPRHSELIPWKVRNEHMHAHPVAMLRLLARRQGGEELPKRKQQQLDKWLREIEEAGVVVCYDPEQGPNPASPKVGGWYYSRRRDSDGDGPIRPPVVSATGS